MSIFNYLIILMGFSDSLTNVLKLELHSSIKYRVTASNLINFSGNIWLVLHIFDNPIKKLLFFLGTSYKLYHGNAFLSAITAVYQYTTQRSRYLTLSRSPFRIHFITSISILSESNFQYQSPRNPKYIFIYFNLRATI